MEKMKKRLIWIAISICAPLLVGVVIFSFTGKKPYKNLDAAEIVSANVYLIPPDRKILIEDVAELVNLLRNVVIYQVDNSYTQYAGQGVIFTLTMSDGVQTEINAYNPFLIIDGVGYRTAYGPCEALNSYANGLLDKEDAIVILEEPPILTVFSDHTGFGAIRGTYSWTADGTSVEIDSAHPFDRRDLSLPFVTSESTAELRFGENPDAILNVRCWNAEHWFDSTAGSEDAVIEGNMLLLKYGAYIYEVEAEWNCDNGYGGIAHYFFYVECLASDS